MKTIKSITNMLAGIRDKADPALRNDFNAAIAELEVYKWHSVDEDPDALGFEDDYFLVCVSGKFKDLYVADHAFEVTTYRGDCRWDVPDGYAQDFVIHGWAVLPRFNEEEEL